MSNNQVLVVDDDPTVSDVVRRYLEQAGCDVPLAADGPTRSPRSPPSRPTWSCST